MRDDCSSQAWVYPLFSLWHQTDSPFVMVVILIHLTSNNNLYASPFCMLWKRYPNYILHRIVTYIIWHKGYFYTEITNWKTVICMFSFTLKKKQTAIQCFYDENPNTFKLKYYSVQLMLNDFLLFFILYLLDDSGWK